MVELGERLGHKGVIISRYPNGGFDPKEEDAPFWDRVCDAGIPVQIHIGSFRAGPTTIPLSGVRYMGQVAGSKSGTQVIPVVEDLLFSGILDRWPQIKFVMVEGNIGWIPTMLEQTDDLFLRYRFWTGGARMKLLPSEYFYRNIYNTFLLDPFGVANRQRCGIDRIMWSTDFPHSTGDWPNSRVTMERNFRGVPYEDVKKMTCTTAATLYRVRVPDRTSIEAPGRVAEPVAALS